MTKFRKTATAAIAALSMGATLVVSTGEAKAWCGYYGCGYGYAYGAGAVAAGVAGGLALGAIAAASAQDQAARQRHTARHVRARHVSQR